MRISQNSTDHKEYIPSLATNRLAMASGILVPAAKRVNPITVSGIPNVSPEMFNKSYCFDMEQYVTN